MINNEDLNFKIIQVLDSFFSDKRGYEFTLFFWGHAEVAQDVMVLDLKFTFKIEDGLPVHGGSGFRIAQKHAFQKEYLGCPDNIALSENFSIDIKDGYLLHKNQYMANYHIVNGVIFYRDDWLKKISNLLGSNCLEQYLSRSRYESMEMQLPHKIGYIKNIKI